MTEEHSSADVNSSTRAGRRHRVQRRRAPNYDKPFYMGALYGLLYGLDSSFLAGRCSPVDSDGQCATDSSRDMTVA
ncbi:MAG: hypothetical protein R3A10_06710 [Caldilineaceae bacterium]